MSTKFQRPSGRFDGDSSLRNRKLFQSAIKQAISAVDVDSNFNYLIDACNKLDDSIQTVALSGIPGAKEPSNNGKFLTTDGNNVAFTFVEAGNIANNAVTLPKLQIGNVGELISWDSTQQPITVAKGTENHVLTANAAGIPPEFKDPSQNEFIKAALKLLVPAGTIFYWGGSVAPSGYILADGSSVSRTTYSDLFDVFGTTYGAGDGTTFGIPDLRGRVIIAPDAMGGTAANRVTAPTALGNFGGEEKHQLTIGELPAHNFTTTLNWQTGVLSGSSDVRKIFFDDNLGSTAQKSTNTIGSNTPHNNMQPYIVLNAIIKT
jgi:microcystin-dependent protein